MLDASNVPLDGALKARAEALLGDLFAKFPGTEDEVFGLMVFQNSALVYSEEKIQISDSDKQSLADKHGFAYLIFSYVDTDMSEPLIVALGIDRSQVRRGMKELIRLPPGSPTR